MYMVTHLKGRTVSVLKSAMYSQVSTYKSKIYVLLISDILVDNESEYDTSIPYLNDVGIVINQTAKNEHELRRRGQDALARNVCGRYGTLCPTS
jgi:c-di-GMP-related signal transduction protein